METRALDMSAPDIEESDLEAVAEVLRSGRLALGPKTAEFERLLARRVGRTEAVAVNSGTSALHLIVRGLGLGPGDEVLVPSFTFVASVNAILYEGAVPVFVDIESDTFNIDPEQVDAKAGPRTRAVMAVDVFGHPVEWDALNEVAARRGLRVIDDACEALGAEYRGAPAGSFGAAAAFGFYPNKQITTGEGGIVVTDDVELARAARSLRNQGRDEMGSWLDHRRLGFSYRMNEMSAALGVSQLARLERNLVRRERVAGRYAERLAEIPWVRLPAARPHVRPSRFVYVVRLAGTLDRDGIVAGLASRGIPSRAYFPPAHLQPYIGQRFGLRAGMLPVTEAVASTTLALPFHSNMNVADVDRVVQELQRVGDRSGLPG